MFTIAASYYIAADCGELVCGRDSWQPGTWRRHQALKTGRLLF